MKLRTLLLAAALLPLIPSQAQPQNQAQPQTKSAREAARLNNLGTALMNQQFAQRAVDTFAQAYTTDPTLALAKLNQGIALLYLQQLPQAEQALTLAAAKAPSDPHAWYALGLLYRNQNQPQQSLEAFNKVLALDPADADTHYLAASMHLELGDLDAALPEYRKALALNPIHASALFGLAHSLQRQGHAAEAHQYLVQFQRITTEKLSTPLTHTYGEEGGYGRVEVASLPVTTIAAMIPITFRESWRTPALPASTSGGACLLPSAADATTLVLMGAGDQAIRLFRQSNSNATFEAIPPAETNIHLPGTGLACAIGDYDNDGLPDLALALTTPSGEDQIHLLRNLGDNKFEDVTAASGITPKNHPTSLTFVDFDHDGDLDLFITGSPTTSTPNLLWRNNGNQTFTDWTQESGLGGTSGNAGTGGNSSPGGSTTSAILSDLNNDRAVDLLVTGSSPAPTFFANRRDGPFAATPLFAASLPPTTSVATLDFDKDGWMDVLLTHAGAPGVTLWHNLDGHSFERVSLPLSGALSATAAIPIDFDNDGWIDLALLLQTSTGPQLRILRNLGPAGFSDVTAQLQLDHLPLTSPKSLLAADLRHTGAADLLLTQSDGSALLLANIGGSRNHSLHIALTGLADNKSALGTKVEVFANGLWQKWEITTPSGILAGLGTADRADLVRLLWPTGVPQDEIDLAAYKPQTKSPAVSHTVAETKPQTITELDRRGSSCPTLFAWNGTQYTFISDVIGAAVVGHWVSPTQHNIPDPDEWIKVPGSQLHPHHGTFSLRFGEPMEEVNFVDQVRLVAIDHPAAASAYPNEGFLSSPPFAQTKTIVTSSAHPLAGAWDDHGNNVLPLLSHQPLSVSNSQTLPLSATQNTRHPDSEQPPPNQRPSLQQDSSSRPKQQTVSPSVAQWRDPRISPLPLYVLASPTREDSPALSIFPPPLSSRHPERSEGSPHPSRTRTSPPHATAPTYLRDFTNLPYAGFANPHTLTLDLGPWSPNQPLRLLLHGFIEYFSASSMYSAWQAGLAPIPPYIEAQLPNESGDKPGAWQRIVDDMGFPAGLPRTVVVDLTGKLPPGATRIRITTNLQIYWDQALVDNEAQPSNEAHADNLHQTELPLAHADLALRGYPQQIDGHTPGDLTYNYQSISSTGPFVPHRGSYTRYGDVTPLLHAIDDQFVIFGTGEDMDLEFSAAPLPPLPTGWTRDFFFYANGFVKDMDFYEATPFAVGSLPFHGMSAYPYPATEHYPDDPAHTAYQLNYNTRYESGSPTRPYQFHYQPQASTPPETNPQ